MAKEDFDIEIATIIISQGQNRYRVNLHGDPTWFALMWGWYPDGGDIPSRRWQKVKNVPQEIEDKFKKFKEGLK